LLAWILILMSAQSSSSRHPPCHLIKDIFLTRDTASALLYNVIGLDLRAFFFLVPAEPVVATLPLEVTRREKFPLAVLAVFPIVIKDGLWFSVERLKLT